MIRLDPIRARTQTRTIYAYNINPLAALLQKVVQHKPKNTKNKAIWNSSDNMQLAGLDRYQTQSN